MGRIKEIYDIEELHEQIENSVKMFWGFDDKAYEDNSNR